MASGHEPPERIENVVIFAIMQGNPSTTPSAQTDGLGSPLVSFACPPLGGPWGWTRHAGRRSRVGIRPSPMRDAHRPDDVFRLPHPLPRAP
jgi:hypothetical protein